MEILKPARSGLTPLPGLIEDLARLLHGVGYAPTSVELADLLWLARYLDAPPRFRHRWNPPPKR